MTRWRARALLPLCLLASCSLPPLRGRVEIGRDPYGVFIAEGSGSADLYAFHGLTGEVMALTFSPVREFGSVLSPDGAVVVFLRVPAAADSVTHQPTVWGMNLLSGRERELPFPPGTEEVAERVGWSADGQRVYVETDRGVWEFAMPPDGGGEPVREADRAGADSALRVMLGSPAFARAEACTADPSALCATGADGIAHVLAQAASSPARWGSDSIGFVRDGAIHVWPLGGGAPRVVELKPARAVRDGLSFFPGALSRPAR